MREQSSVGMLLLNYWYIFFYYLFFLQVERLTKEFSVYMTKDGRISMAGVTIWECGLPGTRDPYGHQVERILPGELHNQSSSVNEEHHLFSVSSIPPFRKELNV